ncbi:MAG: AraC family transcriptional regulator [Planctomycetes bacterium]|nr:AraC family transcriptional regulator [Planctomycetota bacterium]
MRASILDGTTRGAAWHHRSGRRMAVPHSHAELEVNLVVEGRAAYVIDGRRVELAADHLLFLHPEEEHLLVAESADFRMWLAVWRPELVAAHVRVGLDPAAAAGHPAEVQLRQAPAEAARRLARLFADVAAQDGVAREAGATYLLWRCRAVFAAAADPGQRAAHPACARASRLLREDPGLPVAAVAAQVGLTADHLERVFRRETGLGLAAYRARLRLERALGLWESGTTDLTRLALDCGFGSYSAFQRAFRARYGGSPSELMPRVAVDDRVVRG